jgi:hypothetical protein
MATKRFNEDRVRSTKMMHEREEELCSMAVSVCLSPGNSDNDPIQAWGRCRFERRALALCVVLPRKHARTLRTPSFQMAHASPEDTRARKKRTRKKEAQTRNGPKTSSKLASSGPRSWTAERALHCTSRAAI